MVNTYYTIFTRNKHSSDIDFFVEFFKKCSTVWLLFVGLVGHSNEKFQFYQRQSVQDTAANRASHQIGPFSNEDFEQKSENSMLKFGVRHVSNRNEILTQPSQINMLQNLGFSV